MPSALRPACKFIWRRLLSQRNTPEKPPAYGTTALLKILVELGIKLRAMTGFAE
jgi:hypothetical protein